MRLLGFGEKFAREVELVVFHQRLPDRQALRFQKCVGHGAADEHGVGELHQILHHFDFVGNFRAAQDGDERAIGMRNRFAEIGQLFFHQQAGGGLAHEFGDADDGSVRAMRGAECVANEEAVAERCELARKFCVVGFFFGMVAHIFEQQHFPIAQGFALRFGFGTDAICRERHGLPPSNSCSRAATGASEYFGSTLPLGRPRCEASTSRAPRSVARRSVGRVSRMRVSSPTFPSDVGTLKSTRMKTRWPFSCRSRMESLFMAFEIRPIEYISPDEHVSRRVAGHTTICGLRAGSREIV